jgi:CheY-like chemotaxis protein
VVEDDPTMREFTTEAVSELAYTTLEAENATVALSILNSRPNLKLLFTDVVMPDISGKKLADEALARQPDLKVALLDRLHRKRRDARRRAGCRRELLGKPFTHEQLASKLRLVLDQ